MTVIEKVLETLKNQPELTGSEIARRIGKTNAAVCISTRLLRAQGKIKVREINKSCKLLSVVE